MVVHLCFGLGMRGIVLWVVGGSVWVGSLRLDFRQRSAAVGRLRRFGMLCC